MAATEVVFAYPRASRLVEDAGAPFTVDLSTLAPWVGGAPAFFDGWLSRPRLAATLLLTVAAIARSRYFRPISALLLDPILTSGDDRLRLEAFSSCCGVYARADLLPDSLRQVSVGNGTTNVDCNQALRAALALVDDSTPMRLTAGAGGIEVATPDGTSFERRVKLPRRWVKGLGQAGLAQVGMQPCCQVGAPAARRLLAALPPEGTASASEYAVEQRGRDLVFTQRAVGGMLWVAGPFRLRELRPLVQFSTMLRVWARPGGGPGPSAWELELPGARFWLVLSPSVPRGFSGEGQALETLADEELVAEAVALRARLDGVSPPGGRDGGEQLPGARPGWRARLNDAEIADLAGCGVDRAGDLLTVFGSQGLAGRDLVEDGWFRRDLPFSAELIPLLQSRVRRAAEIADADLSARTLPGGAVEVFVRSGDIEHRVLLDRDVASCTCLWHVRHGGSRGPCRHILAARRLAPRPAP